MSTKDDSGPAFPSLEVYEGYDRDREEYVVKSDVATGMSLRDYFAGQVVAAVIAFEDRALDTHDALPIDTVARQAYELADAMLKARRA